MEIQHAIVVDDLAADRRLAAACLRLAGWGVDLARDSVEAERLIAQIVDSGRAASSVIVTDLYMPADPAYRAGEQEEIAGARLALALRVRMERGDLPRMPIIALTAMAESEMLATALAFGCDAVLAKPATPDLAGLIQARVAQLHNEAADSSGAGALLALLRSRLALVLVTETPAFAPLTEHDITKALLAYQRRGVVGLGESTLGIMLAAQSSSASQRGAQIYAMLLQALGDIMHLGAHESAAILRGELVQQLSVAEQCATLGISRSEYYRRRHKAVAVLLELLTSKQLM
jgi:CheY-like chemotaxis protein